MHGYNSIIRAAQKVSDKIISENKNISPELLTELKIIPEYFLTVRNRLQKISHTGSESISDTKSYSYFVGGGTDLAIRN